MKKLIFGFSLLCVGMLSSCIDKYEEVDADSKPAWLGGSIYSELKNPENNPKLTGTFSTYLRLVDDLGYAEVLNRTGSKTLFPANDEAFGRFFAPGGNEWGVTDYNQLTEAQKKLLLNSSMLDNALMLGMLPNISNGTSEPTKGQAVKHATNVSAIDTVQFIKTGSEMPQGNIYWDKYRNKGIHVVNDGTRPMMVHLTREYMINNNITTLGSGSDFSILTGTPYDEENSSAYIFNDRVIGSDVICQNGYIHQMEDVIVPPGNMGELLRKMDDAKLFSRILDYFAVPVYDADVTRNYNDWAVANNKPQIDSIFQFRYLSSRSQGSGDRQQDNKALNTNPLTGGTISTTQILSFDPAWNQFYPSVARETALDVSIRDMGAMFVPDDDAVWGYFQPGGNGSYLMDIYGSKPNTLENLKENLDSLHAKNPQVLTTFAKNLMKTTFSGTVPSKFVAVTNDASENMGLELGKIKQKDGKYDIKFANNGVIYKMTELIAPDEYRAVMAPTSVYPDMQVMGWAVQDGVKNGDYLGVDFKYYLLAMSANYAFFIPEDAAFDYYYIDPASLGKKDSYGDPRPEVLHFYADQQAIAKKTQPYVKCTRQYYNPTTGEVYGNPVELSSISEVKSQLVDILNYHTLVLPEGEIIGTNHYYKTKHGGEVYVDGNEVGARIMSGEQYEGNPLFEAPRIKEIFNQKNGHSYRMDRVIQPPHQSVYAVLKGNDKFSDFLELCQVFEATNVLEWAGVSSVPNDATGSSEQDTYTILTNQYQVGKTKYPDRCMDYNIKLFNSYNYTLFAPTNDAMNIAYDNMGLPRWKDIQDLFDKYKDLEGDHAVSQAELDDKSAAKRMLESIRDFVRYHFMTSSVYVDNSFEVGEYQSLCIDNKGVAKVITIGGKDGVMTVRDISHKTLDIRASDRGAKVVNKMARDYWLTDKTTASKVGIETSSFCAIHEISTPLCPNVSGRYDQ